MPQVAAYFAAEYLAAEIAWAAVESFTLDIVGFQAVSAASTFAIAAGTSQLLARNASSLAEQVRGQQINFRSSTAARQMIYGRYLVGGPIVFAKAAIFTLMVCDKAQGQATMLTCTLSLCLPIMRLMPLNRFTLAMKL